MANYWVDRKVKIHSIKMNYIEKQKTNASRVSWFITCITTGDKYDNVKTDSWNKSLFTSCHTFFFNSSCDAFVTHNFFVFSVIWWTIWYYDTLWNSFKLPLDYFVFTFFFYCNISIQDWKNKFSQVIHYFLSLIHLIFFLYLRIILNKI